MALKFHNVVQHLKLKMVSGNFRLSKLNSVYGTDVGKAKTFTKFPHFHFTLLANFVERITMY